MQIRNYSSTIRLVLLKVRNGFLKQAKYAAIALRN